MKLSKRNSLITSSIFAQLDDKKNELLRSGQEVINLSVGSPDFKPDPHVMDALITAASDPKNYKYALSDLPELITAVSNWYENHFGVLLGPDEIMSVYGSQEGIAHISFPVCDDGDTVLVPNPGYQIFSFGPLLAGAKLSFMPLLPENDYLVDFDEIPAAVADKASMMIVSYPGNPVTAPATEEFYERLIHFAKKHEIVVVHDNAYADLMLDGSKPFSFLSMKGAKDVGIEFNSLSKTYNLTGCRVSFALGNKELIARFKALRSQIDYGTFLPVQYAAIAALTGPQDIVERNRRGYYERMKALCGGFRSIGWDVPDSRATMFVWAPLPHGFDDSVSFVLEMIEKTGVICVPGESFGSLGKKHVRFALVEPVDTMKRAVAKIGSWLNQKNR